MAGVKVLREELVEIVGQLQFEVETWGELKLMPRTAQMVHAVFGAFERTANSTLLYTSCVPDDWDEYYDDERDLLCGMDSEYQDDVMMLRTGNVEVVEWRS